MSWPTLTTVNDRQSARNIAHTIRGEVKRLRAKVRAALVALRARRKEARAEFRARETEARAELKRRIAELRAERKAQSAEHRQALRETLAAIDAEINANKAELSDVLPEARSYLRALMVRGENLKSAAAIARGRKGGRKTSETLSQIRDMIADEMGVDRFAGGVSAKARDYIAKWLRNPKRKGASKAESYNQFDPHSPYWSPLEQFQHWAEEENHWRDLLAEWAEEESDYEIKHAETSWKRLDAAIRKAEQLLEDAAYCTDPEAYQALEDAITEAPSIDSYDGKRAESLAEKVEELSEELTEECAGRDTDLPFDWDDPKAGRLRAGSIRRMRSRLRKGARKTLGKSKETPAASKPRRVSSATATKPFSAPRQRATTPFKRKLRKGERKKPEPKPKAPKAARQAGRADHAERQQARVERLSARAEKKAAAAEAKRAQASAIGQRFEFGQPIILGHHSTKRALRDREKMDNATRAAVREQEEAQALARRAAAAERNTAISSDDPDAAAKLAERIDAEEAVLELTKIVRKIVARTKTAEARAAELAGLGLPTNHDLIRFAMADPITGRFPDKLSSFIATNRNANLRRMRERLKGLGELAKVPELPPETIGGTTIREADNRIRLEFDSKPSPETIKALKAGGFVWSRSESAWQRKLTPSNRDTVIQRARAIAQAAAPGPFRVSSATAKGRKRASRAVRGKLRKGKRLTAKLVLERLPPNFKEAKAPKAPKASKASKAPKAARAPRAPKTPQAQEARVMRAYDELKAETGLRNVRVASLAARSNLKPAALHAVLNRLHARDKVNPAYGEPTAVDAAERAAAWDLGGERFMLVEIDPDGFDAIGLREREEARHLVPDQQTIIDAHNRLDRQGYNMTLLFDLRRETRLSRGRFNAAIQQLRKDRRAYLESSQGQAVKLTDAQRAAGIQEDGRNLVYFSLNDGFPAIRPTPKREPKRTTVDDYPIGSAVTLKSGSFWPDGFGGQTMYVVGSEPTRGGYQGGNLRLARRPNDDAAVKVNLYRVTGSGWDT